MRTVFTLAFLTVVLALSVPDAVLSEVIVLPHDPQAALRAGDASGTSLIGDASRGDLDEKIDEPADILLVPYYEVDTLSGVGTTTLYAVRNTSPNNLDIEIRYLSAGASILLQDTMTLGPNETYTRNIRDEVGLPVAMDGFTRGYVAILVTSMPPAVDNLVGDYLQIDVANNFATGDRLVSQQDLCDEQEIRFLDFGDGTELRFLINNPRGTDLMSDPPTMVVRPYTEAGSPLPVTEVYTASHAVRFPSSVFTGESFGTLVFDFSNSNGGLAVAEYSAEGRFSVGMNSACTTK